MSETYYKISRAAFEELGDAITDQGGTRPSIYEGSAYASAVRQLSIVSERFTKKAIEKTIVNINSPAVISCATGSYSFPYLETLTLSNLYRLSEFFMMSHSNLKAISFNNCVEMTQNTYGVMYRPFGDCVNLSTIYFPNLIMLDGFRTFQNTALRSVYLPKIERIKYNPFYECKKLETFSGNSSGYHIHDMQAFAYCDALTSVDFSNILEIASTQTFWGCTNLPSDITLTTCSRYCGVSTFSPNVEIIRLPAIKEFVYTPFRSAQCKELYINTDTFISSTALIKSCPNLEKIVFTGSRPSGFMEVYNVASSCSNLKEITYYCKPSVKTYGQRGITNCPSMSILNILYSSMVSELTTIMGVMVDNTCPLGRHEGIINLPESLFSDYMSYYSSISWLTSMFSIYSGGA